MTPTQANRAFAVATALPEDTLLLYRLSGTEALSRPFEYRLELLTTQSRLDLEGLPGTDMTVRIRRQDGEERHVNGIVTDIAQAGTHQRYNLIRATLRPWFGCLDHTRDSRIFENRSVPDIVREVLAPYPFAAVETRLTDSYDPWEYCVQYQESDFAFISRLLEHEGIHYRFRHANGRHILVLCDSSAAHDPLDPGPALRFRQEPDDLARSVSEWQSTRSLQGGRHAVGDFDFEQPGKALRHASSMQGSHPLSDLERFDYPGGMTYRPRGRRAEAGDTIARRRMQAVAAQRVLCDGRTLVRELAAGTLFTLTHHPRPDQNREYLVVETGIELRSDAFDQGEPADAPVPAYQCRFRCVPSDTVFRPASLTPWPRMHGPQTAIVTGKAGEEIWADRYGRVKVRFHWDRSGRSGERTSCWIRVSQSWAGGEWGAQFLPRVGQEVIVDFLDGDPNRPIITGRVYNGDALPPFDPESQGTMSGFRSRSSKGNEGCNELLFEDKAGRERLFLRAERDMERHVRRDDVAGIGGDRHLGVSGQQRIRVGGDDHHIVEGDGFRQVDGSASLIVGEDQHQRVGQLAALEAGTQIHLKAGTSIVLEAGAQVTIKAGGSFITVGPEGVTISGPMVRVNSGGAPGQGRGATPGTAEPPRRPPQGGRGREPAPAAARDAPRSAGPAGTHPVARQLRQAHLDAAAFCEPCGETS
ncbi:type VI secretion system Vgr family protein [Niveispirillum fermenti]|uniref:type VI secretion system Vgr family protein n=1 Tax=Niveispirillum fermenti TaxID=1233113 RepID=UPI003A89773B